MTIPMLHTAEGLWCDRSPVPMTPTRAEDNPHPLLGTLDTSRVGELTPEERARLVDSAMDVLKAFLDQAPIGNGCGEDCSQRMTRRRTMDGRDPSHHHMARPVASARADSLIGDVGTRHATPVYLLGYFSVITLVSTNETFPSRATALSATVYLPPDRKPWGTAKDVDDAGSVAVRFAFAPIFEMLMI
jgi:hypothetical protein